VGVLYVGPTIYSIQVLYYILLLLTLVQSVNFQMVGEQRPWQASIWLGFGTVHLSSGTTSRAALDCFIQVTFLCTKPLPQLAEQSSMLSVFHLQWKHHIVLG